MIFCVVNGWMFHHLMAKGRKWKIVYRYKYLGRNMVAFQRERKR